MRPLRFRFWLGTELQGILELHQGGILDMPWQWDRVDLFTGLIDPTGREIFERDIVYTGGLNCEVEWDKTNCRFQLRRLGRQRTIPQTCSLDTMHIQQYAVHGVKVGDEIRWGRE